MPVVELYRESDGATWFLQVGDEHDTQEKINAKALNVANGHGEGADRIMPGNGEPGWEIAQIHSDEKMLEITGAGDEAVQ